MRKIMLEVEYCMKYDLLNVKIYQKNSLFHPEMILRPLFCLKGGKNTGLLTFNLWNKRILNNLFYHFPPIVKESSRKYPFLHGF